MSQIETLLKLQEADTEILRSKVKLEELPEAAEIMECRSKRKELKGKQDQVVELTDEVNAKLAKLQEEEEQAISKIGELQATLDSTSDYRVTSSITRDMQGQVKRQISIGEEQNELLERQIKIDNLAAQVAGMLHKVDEREATLTEVFKHSGGEIKARIDELGKRHMELFSQLEPALAKRYDAIRAEKGGIAVGTLTQEGYCSVCRFTFLEGQALKLKQGPALTECPNCHRMLVVREED